MQAPQLPIWRSAFAHPQALARLLCIAVAAALIGFELWPALATGLSGTSARPPARSPAVATRNVEQITAADLFGHAANENTNLPQTDLQVTLRAVFASPDPKIASAVIETGKGNAQVVKVGGAVGAAATLHAVYPDRVVLSRNGALETLKFPPPEQAAPLAMAQNTRPPTTFDPNGASLAEKVSPEDSKRAAILQRLEELRARTAR